MRITNQMLLWQSQDSLQTSLQGVDQLRADISSGVTIHQMSDNPTSASEVVRIGSALNAITQFRTNSNTATARASAEESALNELTNTLTRGSELAVGQASGTANAQTRLIAKAEVDQLITYGVSLANTKIGDDYLFAGTRTAQQPFQVPTTPTGPFSALLDSSGNSVNPSGSTPVEVGDGNVVTPNHNGTEVFLNSDALESLRALSTALGNNDVPGITAAIGRLDASNSNVQTLIGTQGARSKQLDNARTNLDSLELTLTTYRSDVRDTEVDKALASLVSKQTLYQAAMGITSKILGMSLANYI